MHGGLGRVDGGIGIGLEEPCFEMGFEKSDIVKGVEGDAKKLAEKVCRELDFPGIEIKIRRAIPDHIGFGSKTQLYLAIASGVCRAYNVKKQSDSIARMVGRGGTSGIGVAVFDRGGFVLDGGHPAKKGFVPSRGSNSPPAPILMRYDFPWWFVCAWPDKKGAHGEAELKIFERNCPIPSAEAAKTARIVLMKILPAMAESDIKAFGEGVNMLQESGFKRIEVDLQRKEIGGLLAFLQKESAGGGMSSFGPVCFGICETEAEAKSLEKKVKSGFNVNTIVTKANNRGARWL